MFSCVCPAWGGSSEVTLHWQNEHQTPGLHSECPQKNQSCQSHHSALLLPPPSQLRELGGDQERGFRGWIHLQQPSPVQTGNRAKLWQKIQKLQCSAWPFKAIMFGTFKKNPYFRVLKLLHVRLHFQSYEGLPKQYGKQVLKKRPRLQFGRVSKMWSWYMWTSNINLTGL